MIPTSPALFGGAFLASVTLASSAVGSSRCAEETTGATDERLGATEATWPRQQAPERRETSRERHHRLL